MKRLLPLLLLLSVVAFAQNGGPFVSLDSPPDGALYNAPANITLSASASDTSGQITSVDFFNGGSLIGRTVSAPYTITWNNVAAGSYSLTAVATDNAGFTATSNQVNITVRGASDQPPTVSITSPANGATFTAPANITVTANAADSDGTVTQVRFFAGSTLIGTATSAPYSITWSNVAAGSYTLTAVATDNAGLTTTSSAVSVTVNSTVQPNYAGYVDHLGCDTIGGWAADRNRLNTSINVEIYDGSTLIQTVFANVSRPDVGTYLGDNGLHGYNIATPARLKDGLAHQVHVKFETSATELNNSPASLTCSGTGVIQGYKISNTGAVFNSPGATITIDGTQSFGPTVNPYTATVTAGSHTVTSSTPAGFSVSYSMCPNCTDHTAAGGHPYVAGTSVTANVTAGGYVDLWWQYTPADAPPTVSIGSPSDRAVFAAPATIPLSATASDSDGTVTQVQFFANGGLIGTVTASPYNFTWSNVAAGSYSLTAVATDNAGLSSTSSPVNISVTSADQPPTVRLTAPLDGSTFAEPASITVTAKASDIDGTVTQVQFFAGSTLIGTATSAPYSITWSNVAAGSYSVTAVATDNAGLSSTSSPVNVTVTITFPVIGFIFPKYVVLGVIYAPPGSSSFVNYSNSTMLGTSTSISSSFTDTVSESVSLTIGTPITGSITDMVATSFTQEADTSSSIAVNETTTSGTTVKGPSSSAVGLNHDADLIRVWLNPVQKFKMTDPNTIIWKGFKFDERDNNGTMDVLDINVAYLNGHAAMPPGLVQRLQRSWADDPTDGSGRALTNADFAAILKADPFTDPSYTIDIIPGSDCTADGRFCLTSNQNLEYLPAPPGQQPITQTFSAVHQTTETQGQGGSDTRQISFSEDLKSPTFFKIFTEDLKFSEAFTWTNKWNTLSTQQVGQTAALSITGPASTDNYTGPVEFGVYQDNVYGSFMFATLPPPTFAISATPSLVKAPAGTCGQFTVSIQALVSGFGSNVVLKVSGLPSDGSASFNPPSFSGAGSSTLSVCTTTSSVLGPYPLTISATAGMETHSVGVTLKVN